MSRETVLHGTPHFRAHVTQQIVERGIARNSNHCMIAEAVKEAYPKLSRISVDIQTIRATNKKRGERYIWLTPKSVQHAIIRFDQGEKPTPFNFGLTAGQTIESGVKTPEQKEAMRKAYHTKYKRKVVKTSKKGSLNVPNVIGGKAPPKAVGARRSFGLRALQF